MTARCAWCGTHLGLRPPIGDQSVTHGICGPCKRKQMSLIRQQRTRRTQAKRYAMRRSFERNPHIPGEVVEVRYKRGRKGYYKHEFSPGVRQRRLRPGEKFTALQNAVVLYHGNRPVWEDERTPGFWQKYGHGEGGNPMARRRSQSKMGQYLLWGGLAYLAYYLMQPHAVTTGGANQVIPQSAGSVWYADPFQSDPQTGMSGDQSFFMGPLPPGVSPPWRLASDSEVSALNLGLQAGTLVAAGGGLIVHA
jgi:hypothetical protein